jgi:hypothetical protein
MKAAVIVNMENLNRNYQLKILFHCIEIYSGALLSGISTGLHKPSTSYFLTLNMALAYPFFVLIHLIAQGL